jgi:hypothetical protein
MVGSGGDRCWLRVFVVSITRNAENVLACISPPQKTESGSFQIFLLLLFV